MQDRELLALAARLAGAYLDGLPARPVGARMSREALVAALGGSLGDEGTPPTQVVRDLAHAADAGLVASAGPRYFGFVIGGSLPVTTAADWLTSAWDQNAGLYVTAPAASVVEEIAAAWILDLLGLPGNASVGFVTGATMANFTCLAAARHEVLRRAGWDVEADGLQGAPTVSVIAGAEAHVTVFVAAAMLGLGGARVKRVGVDDQGRMRPADLSAALAASDGPTIVCAQAGNVNSGAFDPFTEVVALTRRHGAWLHVDGAFGLWAAATPAYRHHLAGAAGADSWATDAHKWLNVPYDCGLAIVADPAAHRSAMRGTAAYLIEGVGEERDPDNYTPEFSRRARAFTVYAALRFLGRRGVADLVERCCRLARRAAEHLARAPGVEILNEVVINQVLFRFTPPTGGDPDAFTRAVIARVQREGTLWLGGTTWQGKGAMRLSVSNWATTETDIDRSVDAILQAAREVA
jgi:glutamate/tyrosine decarboxylase-like PLP-dependent enzyme